MFPLWNFFLTRRAFTIVTIAALLAGGGYALYAMPKESTPEVVIPVGLVTTILPGATAADVERLVTDKLEPVIRNVAHIDSVTSTSRPGASIINAQFLPSADIETAINDLRTAVDGVRGELPSDAEVPVVAKLDFQNQPVLMVGVSTELSPTTLAELGSDLQDELITVPGIGRVEVTGVRDRELAVVVSTDALATHGLRGEQVVAAIRSANVAVPAGSLTIEGVDYPVQFEGSLASADALRSIPVQTPSGTVLLGDIATVIDGYERPTSISRLSEHGHDATYALTLLIYKTAGGNILSATTGAHERLDELRGTLLQGSDVAIIYDAGDEIRRSIGDLSTSGLQTVLLVVLILFVAIGVREAFVAALAIPFSFVIAFLGMWVTGNSINFISLFALIIAIGILVDSAIVMVEAIHTNREEGLPKTEAAQKALREFSWPLIAGTATTVAVFVPLFFLSGIIGQFIKSIPFTIVAVLLASIVVALGFIPSIALKLIQHTESPFAHRREKFWLSLATRYRTFLARLFDRRGLQRTFYGILALSFVLALALPATGILKSVFFPAENVDIVYIDIELPQATALAATDAVARVVELEAAKTPHLISYMTTVGSGSIFAGDGMGASGGSKLATITLNLEPDRPSDASSDAIAADLRTRLAKLGISDAKLTVASLAGGPPTGAPIVVKVWSDSTETLAAATETIENLIEATPGTRDVSSSLSNDGTELRIAIDRDMAARYGLSAADAATALRAAITGTEATKARIDGDDVAVRVMFDLNSSFVNPEETTFATADALALVPVATARGMVPLGTFLTITAGRTSAAIAHEDGQRVSSVSSHVQDGENVVEVTDAVRAQAEGLQLEGARLTFGGEDEEIQQSFTEMFIALIAGLVLMFAILVLEFDSLRTSLRLLAAIPLSLTGVLWGLLIMGQPLSFTAFLGIIALAGVIINHGIILLDSLNRRELDFPHEDPRERILATAGGRLRPIVLTTITTVVGVMPLTLVSSLWAPLAFTIAFGLIYGTVLTLVFIPLLSYRYEMKRRAKVRA